ncbi:MAG: potassium-transporting ATPase subunit KdpA [Candidatus Bathyarchaeia archaeon]
MIDAIQTSVVILILALVITIGRLLAPYVTRVFAQAPSRIDRILNPIENFIFKLGGVNPNQSMDWKEYFLSLLLLNVLQMVLAFLVLVFQDRLPLNPQGFTGLTWDLAFNTVVSFGTNTNLQHYAGESTLSYLSQMTAIQFLQFTSAGSGLCAAVAMVRGFKAGSKDLGNFYVDFVKSLTRVLFPLCLIASLILVWLGIPQTLSGYTSVKTIEGATQLILVGPVASLVSIMQIGTNGGGYYGANSAYPLQNPNPASNVFEIILMLLMPTVMCFVYGEILGKRRESRPILWGSYGLFVINLIIGFIPNPVLGSGMEVRFGGFFSAFWTVVTDAVTTGSINASLYGIHPLTILAGFMGMLIQSAPGGKGVGLMYMVMYVVITVFIVGLMSGRTPEYLGMKINARDVTLVMIAFLIHPIIILIPTVLAYATGAANAIGVGGSSLGFTPLLYEFTTAAANNGSDFFGASANTPFFNISTGLVMFAGRFGPMGLLLALAGTMIGRKRSVEVGLKTDSVVFSLVLVGSTLVLVVLTFFPFLALGPILSFLQGHVNGFG